jgi:hypothetical protein
VIFHRSKKGQSKNYKAANQYTYGKFFKIMSETLAAIKKQSTFAPRLNKKKALVH